MSFMGFIEWFILLLTLHNNFSHICIFDFYNGTDVYCE